MTALVHVPRPEDDPGHMGPDAATAQTVVAARKVAIARRRAEVAEMVLCHVPQREIARRLGCGLGTVTDDVKAIKAMWAERAGVAYGVRVARENAVLDALEGVWLEKALDGDNNAMGHVKWIMERRAKAFGTDQPAKVEHSGTIDVEAKRQRATELFDAVDELEERRTRAG